MSAIKSHSSPSSRQPPAPAPSARGGKPSPRVKSKVAAANTAIPSKQPATRRKKDRISPEQRNHYVEVAAYYIAERRGFAPGDPFQDWAQAAAEIDRLLAENRLGN